MNIALLFIVPLILFGAIGSLLIGVLGGLIPWLAAQPWGAFAASPWFGALVKMLLLVMTFVMPLASLMTWMERKQSAYMQDRVGPNRAALFGQTLLGIPHFIADAIKMIMKEDFVPAKANRFLFALAPFMAIVPVFIVFAIVPFGGDLCGGHLFDVVTDRGQCTMVVPMQIARLDVGLLFYFAIASLAVFGTTLAGWASYNKWSLLGGLRASSQMMSYEVTMGLAILGVFLVYGTLEPAGLVTAQTQNPSHWGIILQPAAAILFFIAAIAETKRTPFDIPEGESEVIGYFVEYSGMRFGIFFLAEFIEVIFTAAIMTTVFFGGWQIPFLFSDGFHFGQTVIQLPHALVMLMGFMAWGIKTLIFCWLQLMIRWTLPRMRPDQLMDLGWKKMLPLSIANVLITAFVILAAMAWRSP